MWKLIIIIGLLFFNQNTFSQNTVIRIIDSNLFQLNDSSVIKLAGIDIPRLDHPDIFLEHVARDAANYAAKHLLNKSFDVQVIHTLNDYKLVNLIKQYPLEDKIMNSVFLEEGFGKISQSIDTTFPESFTSSENSARVKMKGIWKHPFITQVGMLDQENSEATKYSTFFTDSLDYLNLTIRKPGIDHILHELALAPFLGAVTSFGFTIAAAYAYSWTEGKRKYSPYIHPIALISMYSGYVLGSSFAVYSVAENTRKQINFGNILLSNLVGAGLAVGIAALNDKEFGKYIIWSEEHPGRRLGKYPVLNYGLFLFPIISSVIYANYFAPDKFPAREYSSDYKSGNRNITAADEYNRSRIFEMNLLRINF